MAQAITGVAEWLTTIAVTVAVPICGGAVSWGGLKYLTGGGGARGTDEGLSMVKRYGTGFLFTLGASLIVGELKKATGL